MEHVVEVSGWDAELEESRSGEFLLRIKITAAVDGVRSEHLDYLRQARRQQDRRTRRGEGQRAGGREADAERYSALIKALTGEEPKVYHMKDGRIIIKCYRNHLDGFARYAELADDIEKWLEETDR
jgi:hypothetical protein